MTSRPDSSGSKNAIVFGTPQSFRPVPRTGVIFVMTEAERHGYVPGSSDWINLGQGAPETGPLPGAPDRLTSVPLLESDYEYSSIDGTAALREAVADFYNRRYRVGKRSQYTKENVAIASGGRTAVTRLISTLGRGHVGHFLPDYTAYEELLEAFHTFTAIPILTSAERGYRISTDELREEILGRGLSAILLSNPCNPTGSLLAGDALKSWVETAAELDCTLMFDEFYSHYLYSSPGRVAVSAAEFVEDVNSDPVVVLDGLTKNWRYPGFRVSWTLGPRPIIEAVSSAGSFLDGGCSRPMQRAALELLKPELADQEARSIQKVFAKKREVMLKGLERLGVKVAVPPEATFYCWGDVSGCPANTNTGMLFFRQALEARVIVVPGVFFDINPGKRRPDRESRFGKFVRFSFGPSLEDIEEGLRRLEASLNDAKK